MYLSHFGLAEAPFSIAPAPRFLYMSQRHQEALAHLLYGMNGDGGFVLLTGEVGTGKTTICRCLLEQIPESCEVAYIFNPMLTVEELLSTICVEFGIACPPGNTSNKVFVDRINAHLLEAHAKGGHAVLIIDEAQNLAPDVLEQMRLLTNLETSERKLLRIILLGQPELGAMLARPELRQLAQRIVARYHLGTLTKQEVAAYVRHRLEVAGTSKCLIPPALMGRLHHLSGGIPRVLNVLCDRALLGAFVQGKERVDRRTLAQAAREVLPPPPTGRRRLRRALAAGLTFLVGGALALALLYRPNTLGDGTASLSPARGIMAAVPKPDAKADAARPPTLEWPGDAPLALSETMAYATVFRAWGEDYRRGNPCRHAERLGLRCRAERAGLDELRRLNRPAVLRLRDGQGRVFYGALLKLGAESATLVIGTQTRTVPLNALSAQWSGHYGMLWRMPPEVTGTIRPGEHGPAVAWLGRQLARLQGGAPEMAGDPVFDAAMADQVKQLQLAWGLSPDGAVGQRTLVRLLSATDASAPSLAIDQNSQGARGQGGR